MKDQINKIAKARCPRCLDTGIWLTPKNEIALCPQIQLNQPHEEKGRAAGMFVRSAQALSDRGAWINPSAFQLGALLCAFDSARPCPRQRIMDYFFAETNLTEHDQLRKFHRLIEDLRKIWHLPIGSRKVDPSGYWMITEPGDFRNWIERAASAPVTQLQTIRHVAEANFPEFLGLI